VFRRTFAFLFLLFVSPVASPLLAQSNLTKLPQTVPIELSNDGHVLLRVRVNDSQPLLFGFDTGFEQTAITTKEAKTLGLRLFGASQVVGAGENTEDFAFTKNVSFDLSGTKFKLAEVGVLDLDFPSSMPDEQIAGILGWDFISRFVVELDFVNKTLRLHDARTFRYRGRGNILPLKMIDNYPSIRATVTLPGLGPVIAMFEIDTGAGKDIFFYSPFVNKHKLFESTQAMTQAKSLGVGGTSSIRIGKATTIQIGRTVIANPVVHFSEAVQGDSASTRSAGFLGNGIFRQFKLVIFDPIRKRMILEPNQ
jgi:hypothetical protein